VTPRVASGRRTRNPGPGRRRASVAVGPRHRRPARRRVVGGVPPVLDVDVARLGAAAVLRVAGPLVATTAGRLAGLLDDLLAVDVAVVVLDLLDLDSLDDTGVGVLVAATAGARRRGAVLRVLADAPRTLDPLRARGPALHVCDLTGSGRRGGRAPARTCGP